LPRPTPHSPAPSRADVLADLQADLLRPWAQAPPPLALPFPRFRLCVAQLADNWAAELHPRALVALMHRLYLAATRPAHAEHPQTDQPLPGYASPPRPRPPRQQAQLPAPAPKAPSRTDPRRRRRGRLGASGSRKHRRSASALAEARSLARLAAPARPLPAPARDIWRSRYLKTGGNLAPAALLAFLLPPLLPAPLRPRARWAWADVAFWFHHPLDRRTGDRTALPAGPGADADADTEPSAPRPRMDLRAWLAQREGRSHASRPRTAPAPGWASRLNSQRLRTQRSSQTRALALAPAAPSAAPASPRGAGLGASLEDDLARWEHAALDRFLQWRDRPGRPRSARPRWAPRETVFRNMADSGVPALLPSAAEAAALIPPTPTSTTATGAGDGAGTGVAASPAQALLLQLQHLPHDRPQPQPQPQPQSTASRVPARPRTAHCSRRYFRAPAGADAAPPSLAAEAAPAEPRPGLGGRYFTQPKKRGNTARPAG
jgi:hypothetical protein